MVRRTESVPLSKIIPYEIREVFRLEPLTNFHVQLYRTLCRVFGEDEKNAMPISLMYVII